MTPMAQVVHVLRKDLREHRLRLALFAALVLVAVARAVGAPLPVNQNLLSVLVFLAGIAIVAAPVEGDPPADPRSFWRSRPVSPWAMLAAKLAFVLLLLLLAGAAQAVALWSLDLRTPEAVVYLTRPVALFGILLLATLVVAAASDESRARLTLIFGLLLGLLFAAVRLATAEPVAPWVKSAAMAAVSLLMLGTLAACYRSRVRGAVAVGASFVILTLGGLTLLARTTPGVIPPVGPDVPRPQVRLSVPPGAPTVHRDHIRLRLSAAQPARGWQYSMREPGLVVTLGSGRVIRLKADQNFMNFGGDAGPMPSPIAALREPGEETGWQEVSIPFRPEPRVQEGDTIQQVTLTGTVLVTRLRFVDSIPLRQGVSQARKGVRTIIDSVTMVGGSPEVVVRAEGLTRPEDQSRLFPFTSYFGRAYLLVGRNGDRVPMRQTWTASSSVGLVLPTGAFGDARMRLAPIESAVGGEEAPRWGDAASLQGASLLAIEPKVQGSYPIALEWRRAR